MSASESDGSDNIYDRDKVIKIINSVINKVEQAEELSRESLFKELNDLRYIIEAARNDIRGLQPADINQHIPSAHDELDAVVEATATATGQIMDACENIMGFAETAPAEAKDKIINEVTNIFEACSFQDITGQRITKVISTLKQIESKVNSLLNVLGEKIPGLNTQATPEEDTRVGDARLLNGPQMADKAISQDDIDKLLADF